MNITKLHKIVHISTMCIISINNTIYHKIDLHEILPTPEHPVTVCWIQTSSSLIVFLPSQSAAEQSVLQVTELH